MIVEKFDCPPGKTPEFVEQTPPAPIVYGYTVPDTTGNEVQ
jgi:hypothetical protein